MRNSRLPTIASSKTKQRFNRLKLTAALLAASQWAASGAWAGPQGGSVVGGAGTITQQGHETRIDQHTDRLAIDWRSFDVAANERVEFVQPSSSSIALNRVVGNTASQIMGRIDANGRVILVNSNGIVFGKDAVVNVGGLVASGLSIDTNAFLNGAHQLESFADGEGKIINYGTINASVGGSVALVGQHIQNEGLISAQLGSVQLASGSAAVLTFEPQGMIGVRVTEAALTDQGIDTGIINNGQILAEGGKVLLTASKTRDIFSEAVNHKGLSADTSVLMHDDGSFTLGSGVDVVNTGTISTSVNNGAAGEIVVVGENITNTGRIFANANKGAAGAIEVHAKDTLINSGESVVSASAINEGNGGDIKLLGNKVGLSDKAQVLAEGFNDGGQVLIGGDVTGSNPKVRTAELSYIGSDAVVSTDSEVSGSGGKLVVFSEDTTRIYGSLFSRGGIASGDGGFIETSGIQGFFIGQVPDVSAYQGNGGTWLIDPSEITITDSIDRVGDSDFNDPIRDELNPNGLTFNFSSAKQGAYLTIETLVGGLNRGNVSVIASGEEGTINFNANLNIDYGIGSSRTLTLDAKKKVNVNGNIQSDSGKLNVNLLAENGDVNINSSKTFITKGGNLAVNAKNFTLDTSGDIGIETGGIAASRGRQEVPGGSVTITATGDIKIGASIDTTSVVGGNNQTTAGGAITLTGKSIDISGADNNVVALNAGNGNIILDSKSYLGVGSLLARDITLIAKEAVYNSEAIFPSYLVYQKDNSVISATNKFSLQVTELQDESDSIDPSAVYLKSTKLDGNNYLGSGTSTTPNIKINSIGDVKLKTLNRVQFDDSSIAGNLVLNTNGSISQGSNTTLSVAGDATLELTSVQNVNLGQNAQGGLNLGGNLSISGAKEIIVKNNGDLNLGEINKAANAGSQSDVYLSAGVGTIYVNEDIFTTGDNRLLVFESDISVASGKTIGSAAGTIQFNKNIFQSSSGAFSNIIGEKITFETNARIGGDENSGFRSKLNITANSINIKSNLISKLDGVFTGVGSNASITVAGGNNIWNVTGNGNGEFKRNDNAMLRFSSVATINGGSGVDIFNITSGNLNMTLDGGGYNDDFNISGTANDGNLTIISGDDKDRSSNQSLGQDTFDFSQLTTAFVFNANGEISNGIKVSGIETVIGNNHATSGIEYKANVASWEMGLDGTHILRDGSPTNNAIINFTDIKNILGNGDGHQIKGANATTTWTLTGDGVGSLEFGASNTINFHNVDHILGSAALDIFRVEDGARFTSIVGNGGNDLADFSGYMADITLSYNGNRIRSSISNDLKVERILGHETYTTLATDNNTSQWMINDATDFTETAINAPSTLLNSGTLGSLKFTNIAAIKGGSGVDTFTFYSDFSGNVYGEGGADNFHIRTNVSGDVDAGEGNDTFYFYNNGMLSGASTGGTGNNSANFTNVTQTQTVQVTNNGISGLSNIKRLVAPTAHSFSLKAMDEANTWVINDVTGREEGTLNGIEFVNFKTLIGGSRADTFDILGAFTGNINGNGGADVFHIRKNTSGAIDGGAGDDSFIFYGSNRVDSGSIAGGTGSNTVDLTNANDSVEIIAVGRTVYDVTDATHIKSASNKNHRLKSNEDINNWVIKAVDVAGTLSDGINDGEINGLKFTDFKRLDGGEKINNFTIYTNFDGHIFTGQGDDNFHVNTHVTGNISSGQGSDTFFFYDAGLVDLNKVDAGEGQDTINLTNLTEGRDVILGNGHLFNIKNVERIAADTSKAFSLKSTDASASWHIFDFDGDGTVADGKNDGVVNEIEFVDFTTLYGSNYADVFTLDADFVGQIYAENGKNTFNINTIVKAELIGGADNDTFVFMQGGQFDTASGGYGDGAGGFNTVDYSQWGSNHALSVSGTAISGVNNVNRVVGSQHHSMSLQVSSGTTTWEISDFDQTHTLVDGINDGVIKQNTWTLEFIDFDSLIGGSGNDTFEFKGTSRVRQISGGAGTNTLIGSDIDSTYTINATGSDVITRNGNRIADFTNIQTIQGGSGNDVFIVNRNITSLKGGAGDDTFTLNAKVTTLDGEGGNDLFDFSQSLIGAVDTLKGGDGNNTILGRNAINMWSIDEADVESGTVSGVATNYIGSFDGIKHITGGTEADTFNLDASFGGSIDAGNGNNIFNINTHVDSLLGGIHDDTFIFGLNGSAGTIDGHLGINSIQGRDQHSEWLITGDYQGVISNGYSQVYLNTFVNIQRLDGQSSNDNFVINGKVDHISAGAGNDEFDFSQSLSGHVNIIDGGAGINTLKGKAAVNLWKLISSSAGDVSVSGRAYVSNFTNINNIVGNNTFVNTLNASTNNNNWVITGLNKGTLDIGHSEVLLSFDGITDLEGGSAVDEFTVKSGGFITGSIDGGSSNSLNAIEDRLIFSAEVQQASVALEKISSNLLYIKNIERVVAQNSSPNNNSIHSGNSGSYRWVTSGSNAGTVFHNGALELERSVKFDNFGNLRGGSASDRFLINHAISGVIDGGLGEDFADYSQNLENIDVNLGAGGLGLNGLINVEGVIGNYTLGGVFKSVLNGHNSNTEWFIGSSMSGIDGVNDGYVTIGGVRTYFENFSDIKAGQGSDTFKYLTNGKWLGTINGGQGVNTIETTGSSLDQVFGVFDTSLNQSTLLTNINDIRVNTSVNNSLVSTARSNNIEIDQQGRGVINNTLSFSGIDTIITGEFNDAFKLANTDQLTGKIVAGAGRDTLDLTSVNKLITVSLNTAKSANLRIDGIESINANTRFDNQLFGNDTNNSWLITGQGKGSLNNIIDFQGFSTLYGGNKNDTFTFSTNSSWIRKGVYGGLGSDIVDYSGGGRAVRFDINPNEASVDVGALAVYGVEELIGDATSNNTVAISQGDTRWTIDASNAGTLSSNDIGLVTFKHIGNLMGGSGNDVFSFEGLGTLSGLIDGQGHSSQDTVDVSKAVNFTVQLTTQTGVTGFKNIEHFIGNGVNSVIRGDNTANLWSLSGSNQGNYNGAISFSNFSKIIGGSGKDSFLIVDAILDAEIDGGPGDDIFEISNSRVSGLLSGGDGDDQFNVNFTVNDKKLSIDGSNGNNRLTLSGGEVDYVARHQDNHFQYGSDKGHIFSVYQENISTIVDQVIAHTLSIQGTSAVDMFNFDNQSYSINDKSVIHYANKSNLDVRADEDDTIQFSGDVKFAGDINLHNAKVISIGNGFINGESLTLSNIKSVGEIDKRLLTSVNTIQFNGSGGSIYLNEIDDLRIDNMTTSLAQMIDITLGGDLSSSGPLFYTGDLIVESKRGNILLDKKNNFTGSLSLKTQGDIFLANDSTIRLAALSGNNVTLTSGSDITSTGSVNVTGLATLHSNGSTNLTSIDNNFNRVNMTSNGNVAITDRNNLTIESIQAKGNVEISAAGPIVVANLCTDNCGTISAVRGDNVILKSGQSLRVEGALFAANALSLNADSAIIINNVTAKSIDALFNGNLSLLENGRLIATGESSMTQRAESVDQQGGIESPAKSVNALFKANLSSSESSGVIASGQSPITLKAASIDMQGGIESYGDISIFLNGDYLASEKAFIKSANGNVSLDANDMTLALISADKGNVITNAKGRIIDGNGSLLNIHAERWQASANEGIGIGNALSDAAADAIEIIVGRLWLSNTGSGNGTINISNTGEIVIESIKNNGNISLVNRSGDVILDNSDNAMFDVSKLTAQEQGGVINANTENKAVLNLLVDGGTVRAINKANKKNPDIIAYDTLFNTGTTHDFGERNRKIILHVPNTYNQVARWSFVDWFLRRPNQINDLSQVPPDTIISGKDQLIEIEALTDIDPAIFTNLRNYVYDEVAILLPTDQQFNDEQ